MILTCPQCAARYQVEDGRVGPEGRTVRCANCGHAWRALPDLTLERQRTAPEGPPPVTPTAPPSAAKVWREHVQTRRETVRAAGSGVAWTAAIMLVIAALAAAVVFKSAVVAAIPQTASLFAAIGLPVNPTGIEFESVAAQPVLQDGRALVVVTGVMRNIGERPVTPQGVRVALLDRRDRELAVRVARSSGDAIPAGQTRGFTLTFDNPPTGATSVIAQLTDARAVTGAPSAGAPRFGATAQ